MNEVVNVKDIDFPIPPNDCPQIDFGQDFEDFDDKRKIIYLKKLCSAMNHATDLIQQERNELLQQNEVLTRQAENAENRAQIHKDSLMKGLTESNAEKQELYKTIAQLHDRVRAQDAVIKELNGEE